MLNAPIPPEGELTLLRQHLAFKRRASVRYKCNLATPGHIRFAEEHHARSAWVVNLSATGLGLVVGQPWESGTPLLVHVKSAGRGAAYDLRARVVHATPRAEGDW